MTDPTTPIATSARFPTEYGQTPETTAELRSWGEVAERIAASPNYWLSTTTEAGRPHLRPVDGVFIDPSGAGGIDGGTDGADDVRTTAPTTLAFGGSPETRWVRHLQLRPEVSVSLPDADQAIIVEGRVELVADPDLALSAAVQRANVSKYPQYFGDGAGDFHPFWALHPRRVFAWTLTDFPRRATRFDFDR